MHVSAFRPVVIFSAGLALGLAVATLGISGCGGKPSGKREAADAEAEEDTTASGPEEDSPKAKKPGKIGKKHKGDEPAHIGAIPKDVWPEVWFKQPLAVVSESGAAAGPAAAPAMSEDAVAKPAPTEVAANTAAAAPAAKSGATDWASLISGEVLADESKAIKNKLTQQLQDVGRYNSTYKEMRIDATVLVVLAAIAPDVPETPSWKTNAKYVRDMASEVAGESKANGDKFYKKAKEAYDKLDTLLGGNKPADVGDAAEHVNFSEVASRFYLMQRMQRIANWMKSDVNNEAIFKKESAKLTQEGSVLALLGRVIATPDYPDHDIDEYKGYAEIISQSGRGVVAAVKDGDFKAYTTALDNCQKACNKCHEQFKNN
jgi:hypothetical protein